ncbi:MAG: GNAT family N-acetyltransferase [Sporichthyaceae bacterium]
MSLREVTEADTGAVSTFFGTLSEKDRTFFWDDVTEPEVVRRWLSDPRRSPMCAIDDGGAIAGFAALVPLPNWSAHVAELVLVVAPRARRGGHGRALARAMLLAALTRGFTKVSVNLSADRPGAIAMFSGIGFQGEALLRDHLCEPGTGQMQDLVILSHLVHDTYAAMLAAGMDTVTG